MRPDSKTTAAPRRSAVPATEHSPSAGVWALACAVFLLVLVVIASGCEGPVHALGGGAVAAPRVTLLPDKNAAEVTETETPGTAAATVAGYGTFTGRVVIEGTPPSMPPTVRPSDIKPDQAAVCVYDKIPNEKLVVGPGNGLANVFVYLGKKPAGTKMPEPVPAAVEFDQHYCTFIPHALFVVTGQQIRVLNDDAAPHNVNVQASRNSLPNATIGAHNREGIILSYARPEKGPIRVRCDIHAWMEAWQLPLDHPYGVVTGPDGSFTIANVPAGTHEFTVWHERAGIVDENLKITIEPDSTTEQTITIPAGKFTAFHGAPPKSVVLSVLP